jgi:hypothetical protein
MPDIYLIRKSLQWVKFSNATAVALTGQIASYGSITGTASGLTADTVTVPGLTAIDGMGVTFTSLTGGSGLSTGVKYYLVNSSGSTAKLATSQGGAAIDFTTNITTGTLIVQTDELSIWSSEFRDIFSAAGVSYKDSDLNATVLVPTMTGALMSSITPSVNPYEGSVIGPLTPTNSDEVQHAPLRQTFSARTHWKITASTGPSPLYATWADGDIISNNLPETN